MARGPTVGRVRALARRWLGTRRSTWPGPLPRRPPLMRATAAMDGGALDRGRRERRLTRPGPSSLADPGRHHNGQPRDLVDGLMPTTHSRSEQVFGARGPELGSPVPVCLSPGRARRPPVAARCGRHSRAQLTHLGWIVRYSAGATRLVGPTRLTRPHCRAVQSRSVSPSLSDPSTASLH